MARSKTRRVFLGLMVITPLLAACNAIVGLSDYKKAECSGGEACLDDGGLPDGPISRIDGGDAGDGGPITFVDAAGSDPVAWAKWKMPNYAQDGGPGENIPTYDLAAQNDAGALKDSVSGLTWRPVGLMEKKALSFKQASDLCASAPGGTWRLPTRIELITLLDFSRTPTADAKFGIESQKYWTTSFYRTPRGGAQTPALQTTDRLLVEFSGASSSMISTSKEDGVGRAICILAQ